MAKQAVPSELVKLNWLFKKHISYLLQQFCKTNNTKDLYTEFDKTFLQLLHSLSLLKVNTKKSDICISITFIYRNYSKLQLRCYEPFTFVYNIAHSSIKFTISSKFILQIFSLNIVRKEDYGRFVMQIVSVLC